MYAIIETGGKQFRVEEGSKLRVASLAAEVGAELTLDKVLMVGGGNTVVGSPYVADAKVTAEVVDHGRGDKILVRSAPHKTRFLHPRGWNYYATLRKKLGWNEGGITP